LNATTNSFEPKAAQRLALTFYVAWFSVFILLFYSYFINSRLGGDYAYFLPKLLDEYIHARTNGWLEPQWFTPSFCGGFVGLANPQSTYWSFPHILTTALNPRWSVFTTMLTFAMLGGLGLYLFLRLRYSVWPSLVCSLLFASNGYHVSRMLEGHLVHHGFMLVPLVAWLIVANLTGRRTWTYWHRTAWIALALAYLLVSGAAPILPQWGFTLLLCLAFAQAIGLMGLRASLSNLITGTMLGALIVSPLLLAKLSFMSLNPRSWSPLPQFESVFDSLIHGTAIILSPLRDTARLWRDVINPEALLEWHEFEYGLTAFPLLILFAYLVMRFFDRNHPRPTSTHDGRSGTILFTLLALLPFVVNGWLGEGFVRGLRALPILGSTSSLFRWYVIPMTAVALICAPLLERLCTSRHAWTGPAIASAALLAIALHYGYLIKPEIDSRSVVYDSAVIETAYDHQRRAPGHRIDRITASGDVQRNDTFVDGASQFLCYEAALGYHLQGLRGRLAQGPIELEVDGRLNMFDPACYVYPHENGCASGARFATERRDAMLNFASYRPLPFVKPRLHASLTVLAQLAMLVTAGLLFQPLLWRLAGCGRLRTRRR
jgi:hypothetical protein